MDESLVFAMVRQLAKLQYWATRALDFDHEMSVRRAHMVVREFAGDAGFAHAGTIWWERVSAELEHLNAEVTQSKNN